VCNFQFLKYLAISFFYLDEIITKWHKEDINGIPLPKKKLLTLLFADDQVTISNTEDNLQKVAYKLYQIITEQGLILSVQKTKVMAFKEHDLVKSKIVRDNKITEQVNSFNYLGKLIHLKKEADIYKKLVTI